MNSKQVINEHNRMMVGNYKSKSEMDNLPSRFNYMKEFKSSKDDEYLEDITFSGKDEIL